MLLFERRAWNRGYQCIAGIDEAGRGPLAGPVVAAACVLPDTFSIEVRDSKQLLPSKRFELFQKLIASCDYGIGIVEAQIIDEINILQATFEAMILAINNLSKKPDYILVDGPYLPKKSIIAGEPIIRGDEQSASIAAASILAKVTRDKIMDEWHDQWPQFGFHENKGYPTPKHLAALSVHGPTSIHRKTFAPVRSRLCQEV